MLDLDQCPSISDWDRYVLDHPRATVFHRSAWLHLLARLAHAEVHLFLLRHGSKTVGAVPLFSFRRGVFRIAASPPPQLATPYLGFVCADDVAGAALAGVTNAARNLRASYVELRLDRSLPTDLLRAEGFEAEPRSTFVLDLRPGIDALWTKSLTSACRRAVRKAEKEGVVIEEADLTEIADRYGELSGMVFAKSNRPPPLTSADYREIGAVARAGGFVRVLAARVEGRIVSAGIFAHGNGTIYYLDGVADPEAQQARPNNLLHWEVIRWAAAHGLHSYDMVGVANPGVARFKRTFGAVESSYTYAYRSLNPLAAVARAAYAALAPAARVLRYAAGRLRSVN